MANRPLLTQDPRSRQYAKYDITPRSARIHADLDALETRFVALDRRLDALGSPWPLGAVSGETREQRALPQGAPGASTRTESPARQRWVDAVGRVKTQQRVKSQFSAPDQDFSREARHLEGALKDLEEVILRSELVNVQTVNDHSLRRILRRIFAIRRGARVTQQQHKEHEWLHKVNSISNYWARQTLTRWWTQFYHKKPEGKAVYFRLVDNASMAGQDPREFPHKLELPALQVMDLNSEYSRIVGESPIIKPLTYDANGWKSYTCDEPRLLKKPVKVNLSPEFIITASPSDYGKYQIPLEATHFSFSYPAADLEFKPNVDEKWTPLQEMLEAGAFFYFERRSNHEEMREIKWSTGKFVPDLAKRFKLVHILAVSSDRSQYASRVPEHQKVKLYFGPPHWLKPEDTESKWPDRQDITLEFLKTAKANQFCWVAPQERVGFEPVPYGYPLGGFLYWGDFSGERKEKGDQYAKTCGQNWWNDHVEALAAAADETLQVQEDQQNGLMAEIKNFGMMSETDSQVSKVHKCKEGLLSVQKSKQLFQIEQSHSLAMIMYFTFQSFRVPWTMIIAALVWISAVAGIVMELFFTVLGAIYNTFGKESKLPVASMVVFVLLPPFMVLSAVIVDRMWYLIMDAFAPPYFVRFRAKLLVWYTDVFPKTHGEVHDRSQPSKRACLFLDLFCFIFFEFLPDVGILYNYMLYSGFHDKGLPHLFFVGHEGLEQAIAGGFMTGTLMAVATITMMYIGAEMSYAINEWHCDVGESKLYQLQKIEDVIVKQKILPYFTWSQYWAIDNAYDRKIREKSDYDRTHLHIGMFHRRANVKEQDPYGKTVLALSCVPWLVVSAIFFLCAADVLDAKAMKSYLLPIGAIVLTIAIIGISYKLKQDMPNMVNSTYVTFLIILLVMIIGMLLAGSQFSSGNTGDGSGQVETLSPMMTDPIPGQDNPTDLPTSWPWVHYDARKYPICRMKWGSDAAPMSALDLAALAWISYEPSRGDKQIKYLINQTFSGRNAELIQSNDYEHIPRWIAVHFPTPEGEEDTVVIAIKGTSTLKDGYLDTDLFTFIKALQLSSNFIPVLKLLPRDLVQWGTMFIKKHFGVGGQNEENMWRNLTGTIAKMKQQYNTSQFVVTGHSLGGALAEVVAGLSALPALQWSGPGTHFSEMYFGVTAEEMQRDVVAVVPDLDVVPRVDHHESVVARIQCFLKGGALASALNCHSLRKSTCEVWRVCGDMKKRNFTEQCSEYVDRKDLGVMYPTSSRPIIEFPGH